MSAADATGAPVESAGSSRRVVVTVPKIAVWVVAAVLFVYVLWQAVGNLVGVSQQVAQFNAFVEANGGATLKSTVPWPVLVLDVAIAPIGYAVAWVTSRRMPVVRTVVVFLAALCAVSALWFTILQYVSATLRIGA